MAGYLFHSGAVAQCPHGGSVTFTAGNTKVLVDNKAVATTADIFQVSNCSFQVPVGAGSKPQPCMKATLAPATKVLINNKPAILTVGTTICQSAEQIPQGPASVISSQTKVEAK